MDKTTQYICNVYNFNTAHNDFNFEEDLAEVMETKITNVVTTAYPTLCDVNVYAYKNDNGGYSVSIEAYIDCDIATEYFDYNFCGQMGIQFDGYGIDGFIEPNNLDDDVKNTIIQVLSEMVDTTVVGEIECIVDGDNIDKVIERYESNYNDYTYDDYMADHCCRDDY